MHDKFTTLFTRPIAEPDLGTIFKYKYWTLKNLLIYCTGAGHIGSDSIQLE